jgi:hypothetical protein
MGLAKNLSTDSQVAERVDRIKMRIKGEEILTDEEVHRLMIILEYVCSHKESHLK